MNWDEALALLTEHIFVGLHLDPNANFKIVREVPPYQCGNYNNEKGFRVQVGKTTLVNVPLSMLKTIFEASTLNNNTYNGAVFKELYPRERNNKPCYVHSVGKLFSNAHIMTQINGNDYVIN